MFQSSIRHERVTPSSEDTWVHFSQVVDVFFMRCQGFQHACYKCSAQIRDGSCITAGALKGFVVMSQWFAACCLLYPSLSAADETFLSKLPAPNDWGGETIRLPPAFAADMSVKGVEYIRFAPGMMDPQSDSFFCYAFAFELGLKPELTETILKDEFLKYYRGLCKAVLDGKSPEVDAASFTMTLKKSPISVGAGADDPSDFVCSIRWVEPFATKKFQTLNLEIQTWNRDRRNYVFACVSPKARDTAIWKQLHQIRDGYLKRQGLNPRESR